MGFEYQPDEDGFLDANQIVPEQTLMLHGAMVEVASSSIYEQDDIVTMTALVRMVIGLGPKVFHKAGLKVPGSTCDGTDEGCDMSCQAAYAQALCSGFYKDLLPNEDGEELNCIGVLMSLVMPILMAVSFAMDDEHGQELVQEIGSKMAHADWHEIKAEMDIWHQAEIVARMKKKLAQMDDSELESDLLRELGI